MKEKELLKKYRNYNENSMNKEEDFNCRMRKNNDFSNIINNYFTKLKY